MKKCGIYIIQAVLTLKDLVVPIVAMLVVSVNAHLSSHSSATPQGYGDLMLLL